LKFNVSFYDAFRSSLKDLTTAEQGAVMTALVELAEDPSSPGLNVHRVGDAATKCWSARVNDDIRIIFFWVEQTIVPAYVAHHDAAYRWAEGRALDVHPDTGAAQIVVVGERREEIVIRVKKREEYDPLAERPFRHLTDAELLAYGTPRSWLDTVRSATVKAFLEEIGDALPAESCEFLMAVASGETPPPPPQRGKNPFTHPDAKRRFFVVESDDDLKRALQLEWEQWMLYLHPAQREAVERDFAGPARVTGGPGTGKSVVAVHRAARLAREGRGRVLLTSFSRTLAAHLRQQVDKLMAGDPARSRIDVVHLHQLAVDRLAEAKGAGVRVADNAAVGRAAKAAAERLEASWVTPAFLEAEWSMVVDPYGVSSWEEYAQVDRPARGTPLNRSQREDAWQGLAAMRGSLEGQGLATWSGVCWDLVDLLDASGERPYAHVIADEVQDFGPAELRLLRALAEPGTNDVFLASDANQRIFKPYTPVARAGLEVRGRSITLRVNYRMTEQIRRLADGIASGKQECDEPTSPSVSLLNGAEPEVLVLPGVNAEVSAVSEWLKRLVANGYRPGEVAIFARKKDLLQDRAHRAVKGAGLESFNLESDEPAPSNRVAIGTMHRSKGLQFRAVAVMGVEDGTVPLDTVRARQPDEAAQRAFLEMERNLLYVACSRARERLIVTGVGRPCEFLAR
jgi:mRNA-degrading endonuclease RelE of RelBE toxin-antitoxin system